jgi:hypothetical protein
MNYEDANDEVKMDSLMKKLRSDASKEDWCLDWYPQNYKKNTCKDVYNDYTNAVETFNMVMERFKDEMVPEYNENDQDY